LSGKDETIVAIATGPARGGIGVVRLSGPDAHRIAERNFRPKNPSPLPWPNQLLLYGDILDGQGAVLDRGYAVRMARPNSYTGEEVVEIHGHGSPVTLQAIVAACVERGARLAEPGEFTKRAFLNGRIDLVQAEAVAELIHSESEVEAQAARQRLEGRLSAVLDRLREETLTLLAECEADVDFPEEGPLLSGRPTMFERFRRIRGTATDLRSSYAANRRLISGFTVALVGRPNVGKSSLFNALLAVDRAIVTPQPGTTRDLLREELVLSGCRVRLVDTAGLRQEIVDEVERLGGMKTEETIEKADLCLLICDASVGWTCAEELWSSKIGDQRSWVVWNKTDLKAPPQKGPLPRSFSVSALRGDGVAELREKLGTEAARRSTPHQDGGISNDRQRALLDEYLAALARAEQEAEKNASPEFVAFELRQAHRAASCLLGKNEGVEEVLSEIFSKFCIGK
jgi:tRNA modification GTPase